MGIQAQHQSGRHSVWFRRLFNRSRIAALILLAVQKCVECNYFWTDYVRRVVVEKSWWIGGSSSRPQPQ